MTQQIRFSEIEYDAQKKQTLDVSGGPHALVMRCVGVNPEALAEPAVVLRAAR